MLSRRFLMNDFLESFSLIFGQNKDINLTRYGIIFFYKSNFSLKKVASIISSFMYNKVCLIKATSKILLPFTKKI